MIHGVFKNRVLKSLHRAVIEAAHAGFLDFLEEYETRFVRGVFNHGPLVFRFSHIYDVKEINKDYMFLKDRMSLELVPIAKSESGDRIAIHCRTGHVYLWEKDKDLLTDESAKKETKIASNFQDFAKKVQYNKVSPTTQKLQAHLAPTQRIKEEIVIEPETKSVFSILERIIKRSA